MHSCVIFFLTVIALSNCTFSAYANENAESYVVNEVTSEFRLNDLFVNTDLRDRVHKSELSENYSFCQNDYISNQFCLINTEAHQPTSISKNDINFKFMDNLWETPTESVTKRLNGRHILETDTPVADQTLNNSGLIIAYCIIGVSVALFLIMLCVCAFIDRDDFKGYNAYEPPSTQEQVEKPRAKSKKN
ncbi:uncharacterized protein LOC126304662 [Schistocerca gregaria]|uniref:uncharacterized protein LOC126304662 n=1 Tax=Schistocerca gregaria TaxID=7010 RepID=UPI00211DC658|nr:uncharacterized protein LOC126304662 [Schistocerca gregaria]